MTDTDNSAPKDTDEKKNIWVVEHPNGNWIFTNDIDKTMKIYKKIADAKFIDLRTDILEIALIRYVDMKTTKEDNDFEYLVMKYVETKYPNKYKYKEYEKEEVKQSEPIPIPPRRKKPTPKA